MLLRDQLAPIATTIAILMLLIVLLWQLRGVRNSSPYPTNVVARLAEAPLNTRFKYLDAQPSVAHQVTRTDYQKYGHNRKYEILDVGWVRLVCSGGIPKEGFQSSNSVYALGDPANTAKKFLNPE